MLKFRAVAPALVAAALLGSGCSINLSAEHYIGKEEKTFAVTGKPELTLKTFDGSIGAVWPTRPPSKGYEYRATSGGDQLGPPSQTCLGTSESPIGLEAISAFSF